MFCRNCGKSIPDDSRICPYCGEQIQQKYYDSPQKPGVQRRVVGIVSYITWIGLIVALCLYDRHNEYERFHVNQALVLDVFSVILVILDLIPIIRIVSVIFQIILFIGWLMGLISACSWEMRKAPIFGKIVWLK